MSILQCLTCTQPTESGLSVIIADHGSARSALSKHFWFNEDQTKQGILCQCCWDKIADFHQFYCEIERVHVLPSELVEIKQEPTIPTDVLHIKCEVEANDDEGMYYDENDEGGEVYGNETDEAKHEESSDQESVPSDKNDPDCQPKVEKTKTPKSKRKERPEEFITANVNVECDTCSKKFDSFNEMQKHSTMEHKKMGFVSCCDRKFYRRDYLLDHIEVHLDPDKFQCKVCLKHFGYNYALKIHMDKMHTSEEEKILQCSVCTKRFSHKNLLNAHEKYHRKLAEKKWHCDICDKYYANQTMLRAHKRTAHSTDYKYVCHVCAKGFHWSSSYKDHMESHEEFPKRDKKPAERTQCPECGIWLFKKGLQRHILLHTGSKRCEICGQECKNEMALKYHMAQHRKDSLVCTVCGKSFKRQILLTEHMASHTGEVLYRCDFCDKTFRSHANKAAHRKKMHPKEWMEEKLQKHPHKQHEPDQNKQQYMEENFEVTG